MMLFTGSGSFIPLWKSRFIILSLLKDRGMISKNTIFNMPLQTKYKNIVAIARILINIM